MPDREPTRKLSLDENALSRVTRDLIQHAEDTHRALFEKVPKWRDWYHGIPKHETRNTPFQNASNLVWPLIRTFADQLHAQRIGALTASDRIYLAKSHNEDTADFADHAVDFINDEASGRQFDLHSFLYDCTHASNIFGKGIGRLRWGAKERWRFAPDGTRRPRLITVRAPSGPILEFTKREHIMWEQGMEIHESPWIIRKVPMSRSELETQIAASGWNRENVGKAMSKSPSLRPSAAGEANRSTSIFAPYWVYEILVEMPMLRGSARLADDDADANSLAYPPVMIWSDEHGHILYCGTYDYPTIAWNFYDFTLIRTGTDSHEDGVAAMLEHFQRAATAIVNQRIDAGHLANALMGLTSDKNLVGKSWVPGTLTYTDDPTLTDFTKRPQGGVPSDLQNLQVIFAGAERLMGVSDPGFGRESRQGGHPSPATNFVGLLQQGSLKMKETLKRDRKTITRLGNDLAAFYQAYGMEYLQKRLVVRYGAKDATEIAKWLRKDSPVQSLISFDVQCVDDALNPDVRLQRSIQIDQLASSYFARIIQAAAQMGQAAQQAPQVVPILTKAIEVFTKTYENVLKAASIDDPEKYLFLVEELNNGRQQDIAAVGSAAQQAMAGMPGTPPTPVPAGQPAELPI